MGHGLMQEKRLRLGEILLEAGVIEEAKLKEALALQKKRGLRLGQILLQESFISEPQLVQALSRRLSIPWVSLEHVDIADEILDLVPVNLAEEFFLIPVYIQTLDRSNRTLFIAMNDPTDEAAIRLVSARAGMPVKPMVAGPSDISAAIHVYYYGEEEEIYEEPVTQKLSAPPPFPVNSKPSPPPFKQETALENNERVKSSDSEVEQIDLLSEAHLIEEVLEGTISSFPPSRTMTVEELSKSNEEENGINNMETTNSDLQSKEKKQQVQRQVEKHMFGLGKAKHKGISLTLLDGTTIDFGGANQKRGQKNASEKDKLLATLRAVAEGTVGADSLPSDRWEKYLAALLDVLFRKNLIFPEEFLRALNRKE